MVAWQWLVSAEPMTPMDTCITLLLLFGCMGICAMEGACKAHLPYSKFRDEETLETLDDRIMISSRLGMFILYFVPLVVYIAVAARLAATHPSLGSSPHQTVFLVCWCLHFLKRVGEVCSSFEQRRGLLPNH